MRASTFLVFLLLMSVFIKPDVAIKRADEFLEVKMVEQACDTLYQCLSNRKWRYQYHEDLEKVRLFYL